MPTPDMETARGRQVLRRKSPKRARTELAGFLLTFIVVTINWATRPTTEVVGHYERDLLSRKNYPAETLLPVRKTEPKELEYENIFQSTIKSCFPLENKHCKQFTPENTSTRRVGVIAPPGHMAASFLQILRLVVARAKRNEAVDIELIPTPHVPPYGYGKTHGWTKIIRIVPRPLLVGATEALVSFLENDDSIDGITIEDMTASLKLQVRYHCRMSHVAAHTAMWSVSMGDLIDKPLEDLIDKIQKFLGLEQSDVLHDIGHAGGGSDDPVPPENMESIFNGVISHGTFILTHLQLLMQNDIFLELNDVLNEELRISKNLTNWPCESFWTVGTETCDELTPIARRIAEAMSPDCDDKYTSCWVKRDLCEAKGDGICKDKKKL